MMEHEFVDITQEKHSAMKTQSHDKIVDLYNRAIFVTSKKNPVNIARQKLKMAKLGGRPVGRPRKHARPVSDRPAHCPTSPPGRALCPPIRRPRGRPKRVVKEQSTSQPFDRSNLKRKFSSSRISKEENIFEKDMSWDSEMTHFVKATAEPEEEALTMANDERAFLPHILKFVSLEDIAIMSERLGKCNTGVKRNGRSLVQDEHGFTYKVVASYKGKRKQVYRCEFYSFHGQSSICNARFRVVARGNDDPPEIIHASQLGFNHVHPNPETQIGDLKIWRDGIVARGEARMPIPKKKKRRKKNAFNFAIKPAFRNKHTDSEEEFLINDEDTERELANMSIIEKYSHASTKMVQCTPAISHANSESPAHSFLGDASTNDVSTSVIKVESYEDPLGENEAIAGCSAQTITGCSAQTITGCSAQTNAPNILSLDISWFNCHTCKAVVLIPPDCSFAELLKAGHEHIAVEHEGGKVTPQRWSMASVFTHFPQIQAIKLKFIYFKKPLPAAPDGSLSPDDLSQHACSVCGQEMIMNWCELTNYDNEMINHATGHTNNGILTSAGFYECFPVARPQGYAFPQ